MSQLDGAEYSRQLYWHRGMDKNYILEEVRRCAKENGGEPVGRDRFSEITGILESDWINHWPRYVDVLIAAKYRTHEHSVPISDKQLLEQLVSYISE